MKIITLFLIISVFFKVTSYSQSNAPTVAPPTPHSLGSSFSASVPVNQYNGLSSSTIPLMTIEGGTSSMNVQLSHVNSGIKVGQLASSVGLGWNHNAGGVITRIVRGLPDECKIYHKQYVFCLPSDDPCDFNIEDCYGCQYEGSDNFPRCPNVEVKKYYDVGLLHMGEERYNDIVNNPLSSLSTNDREALGLGVIDTEPDLFIFNFQGYNGQFIFKPNGEIEVLGDATLKVEYEIDLIQSPASEFSDFEYQPTFEGAITQFKVITPNGYEYIFNKRDASFSASITIRKGQYGGLVVMPSGASSDIKGGHNNYVTECSPKIPRPYLMEGHGNMPPGYYTAWHLTEIINDLGHVEFELEYDKEVLTDHSQISAVSIPGNLESNCNLSGFRKNNYTFTNSLSISQRIKKITSYKAVTPYEEIVFQYDEIRNDIKYLEWLENKMGSNYQKAKLLNFIKKRNLLDDGDVMLEASLSFDQHQFFPYQDESGEGSGYCEIDQRVIEHFTRPYLEEIQITGYAVDEHGQDVVLPPFVLEYYNKDLPPRHSYNIDMWGYYNRNERGDFQSIVCEEEETRPPIYGTECDDQHFSGDPVANCNPEDVPPGFPVGWDPVETEYSIGTQYDQHGQLECVYNIWTRYEKGEKIPYSLLPKTYFYPKDPYNSIYGTEFSLWPRIGYDDNNLNLWSILNPEGPDRLPNETFAKNGSLNKITQPSGNFSEIELELNEVIDQSAFFENFQESFNRCIEDPDPGNNPSYSGEVFSCSQTPSSNDVNIVVPSGEAKLINIEANIHKETREELFSGCFEIYDNNYHSNGPCENCVLQWINDDIQFTVNDYGAPGYKELFLEVEVSFSGDFLYSPEGTLNVGPHENILLHQGMTMLTLPITPGNHSLKFNYNYNINEFDYQCIEVKLTLVEVQEPIVYGKIYLANGIVENIRESGASQFYLEEGNYTFEMVDHSSDPGINGYFQHGAEFTIDVFCLNEEISEDQKLSFGGLRVKNIQNFIDGIGTTIINYDYEMENGTTSGVAIQPPLVGALKTHSTDCQISVLEKKSFNFSFDQGAPQLLSDYAVGYRRVVETTEGFGINEYYFDIPSVFGFSSFGCENNSCLYTVPVKSTIGLSNKNNFLNVPFVPASGFDYYRSIPRKVLTKDMDGTLVKKVETEFEALEIEDFFAAVFDLQLSNNTYQWSEMNKACGEEPEWWENPDDYDECMAYLYHVIFNNIDPYIEFGSICGNTDDEFKWEISNNIHGFKGKYSIKSVKYVPVETVETIYYPGHPLVTTTLMTYTDDEYLLPHTTTIILPDGRQYESIIEYAYQTSISGANLFVNAGRPWTPVSNLQYLNNDIISGNKSEFKSINAPYSGKSYIRPSKTLEFIENEWLVSTESIEYNQFGNPYRWRVSGRSKDHIRGVDYKGNTTHYGYYQNPPFTQVKYYPKSNRIDSIIDPRGNVVKFKYDGLGRLIEKESRDGQYTERLNYDFLNFEVTKTINTDVGIPSIITKYNGAGNVVSEITKGYCYSGSDWKVSNVYDPFGRIRASNNPAVGGNTVYLFNQGPLKKWQKTLLPGSSYGRFITTEYGTNRDGEVPGFSGGALLKTTTTDLNQIQSDKFETTDGLVVLTRIFGSEGTVETHYEYDQYNRLISVTQPNGEVFTYDYEHLGNGEFKKTKVIPGGGTETTLTDRLGREVERNTALGHKFEYEYDPDFDLLENIKLNNQIIETFEYYTEGSDLRRLQKNTVSTLGIGGGQTIHEYEYDDFGRITDHEIAWPGGGSDLIKYEGYDHRDLYKNKTRTHQSHNNSETFTYEYQYDHGGRLIKEGLTVGTESNVLAKYIYDNYDRVIGKPLGSENGTSFLQHVDYGYHPLGWLKRINNIPECLLLELPDIAYPDGYYTDGSNSIEFDIKIAYDLIGLILGIGSRFDVQLKGYRVIDSTKHQVINNSVSTTSGGIRNPNGGWGTPTISQDSVWYGGGGYRIPGYSNPGSSGWYNPGGSGYEIDPIDPGSWNPGTPGNWVPGTWGPHSVGGSDSTSTPGSNPWYNPGVVTLPDSLYYNYVTNIISSTNYELLIQLIMDDLYFLSDSVTSNHWFRDWLAEDVEGKLRRLFGDLLDLFEDCQAVESDDLFAMEIHYTSGTNIDDKPIQRNFNGNVSWVRWMSLDRDDVYYYGFEYDDLSRLKKAFYSERELGNPTPTLGPWENTGFYDVEIDYEDLAGNVSYLKRYTGASGTGREIMDDLSMTYNGNRLNNVTAGGMGNRGFRQLGSGLFEYDNAGNVTKDNLRDLTIDNNELNLPFEITAIDGTVVLIKYDATGNKLSETTTIPGGTTTVKHYYAGLEVINGDYYQYGHSQGRYMFEYGEEPSYFEYVITDHLGNGRVWFADLNGDGEISHEPEDHEIRQEKHYYPFGLHMEHPDFWVDYPEGDRHQYNSIENVNLSNALLYAAHYRTLDPGLGRWLQVDPAAEHFYGLTPYNSMANNPMTIVDPDGDFLHIVAGAVIGGLGNLIYQAVTGNIQSFGDGLVAFGIGAGAGALGAATGGASLAAMGTASSLGTAIGFGATAGAVGGGTAGFIQNTGNSLYFQNSSLGDALGSGLEGATWGALGGAVLGGIAGGIAYKPNTITGGTNAAATVGDDLMTIKVNGQNIKVPGLEVNATQPSGGLNISAARQTGLYNGPVSSYGSNVTRLPFARSIINGIQVSNPAGSTVAVRIPRDYVAIATRNGKGIIYGPSGVSHNNMSNAIRVHLNPTPYAPNGYVVFYNSFGQPINPNTGNTLGKAFMHFLIP